jgi:uncharacterized protein DUF4203
MDDVLVGLLALGLGVAVCFLGLRLWFFMLPIWGFVAGFFVGAATVTAIFGDGFLSTVSSWIVGIVVGLGFALLSYLFWYAGVMLAAASVGSLLASGFLDAIGVDAQWLVFIISLAAALALMFLALVIALPVYIVIVSSAIVGAISAVTGAMLVFNRIDLADLEYGSAWAMIEESWFWVVVWFLLAAVGIGSQMAAISRTRTELPEDRWTRANPTGPTPPAAPPYTPAHA